MPSTPPRVGFDAALLQGGSAFPVLGKLRKVFLRLGVLWFGVAGDAVNGGSVRVFQRSLKKLGLVLALKKKL